MTEESADVDITLPGDFGYQNVIIHKSEVLGEGSYGTVFKATIDCMPCAAKILHPLFTRGLHSDLSARFDQECATLQKMRHPNIVQFLGVVQGPKEHSPILLMELMDETLIHFLEQAKTSLPYQTQLEITYDIALALNYLHRNSIIHRDLSSNNVLLKRGTQAKVSDFGMLKAVGTNARMTQSKVTQCPGTPAFMPPEARRSEPRYSDKLDTFSLGVLIVQIITRKFPAPTVAEIVMEDDSSPTGEKIVPVPELERRRNDITEVPSNHALLPIALHCLKDRDRERPTAAQLCKRLGQLKTAPAYTASERESQARRASLEQQLRKKEEEKMAENAQLREKMSQLPTEEGSVSKKEQQQPQSKGIEVEDQILRLQREGGQNITSIPSLNNDVKASEPEVDIHVLSKPCTNTAPFNCKLQTSQTAPATREVDPTISQPEVLVTCLLCPTISVCTLHPAEGSL